MNMGFDTVGLVNVGRMRKTKKTSIHTCGCEQKERERDDGNNVYFCRCGSSSVLFASLLQNSSILFLVLSIVRIHDLYTGI